MRKACVALPFKLSPLNLTPLRMEHQGLRLTFSVQETIYVLGGATL